MLRVSIPILLSCISLQTVAQSSDFIVLKKKNNRTLKTYFPGSFISAVTYTGFTLNGTIRHIRNDSVFVEQQEVRQVPTQFGVPALDTLVYTIRLHYLEIRSFYYMNYSIKGLGTKRSFAGGMLPRIMLLGGTGFIVLELVNSAYRHESLSEGNKLGELAIAGAVAASGFLWMQLQKRAEKTGKKYRVLYINAKSK